jgi:general secretion pathway protein D
MKSISNITETAERPFAGQSMPRPVTALLAAFVISLGGGCALVGKLSGGKDGGDAPGKASVPAIQQLPVQPGPRAAQTPSETAGTVGKESLVHMGTGNFINKTPPPAPAAAGPEEFSLNFEATDIRAIVQSIMGDYLRESFSIHPQTSGNATIRLSRPVARKDLIPILEMLLRQNNQVMIREDGLYKVMPAALGTRGTLAPQLSMGAANLPSGYSVQVLQLKYVGAADMQRLLAPYATDPAAATIQIDPVRNLLILSGTQRELKHLLGIVDLFDVDFLAGYSFGLFQMSTDVKALGADIDKIFGDATKSPLAGIVRIIPIERMNALLVISTQQRYLEEAKKWIDRLDKSGGVSGGMRLNVYSVQHGKAEKLAQLLSEIYGNKQSGSTGPALAPGQRPATIASTPVVGAPAASTVAAAPGSVSQGMTSFSGSGVSVSKDVRIIADNDNNSLLILASPSDFETIQGALRQLDVPRRQVSVEVLVAEVTLTDELKFGVEAFVNSQRDNLVGALRGDTGTLPSAPAFDTSKDLRSIVKPSNGLQLINAIGGDIRGIITALGSDGRAQVVSTPRVMVLDNEKASINVGTQISVDTGTTTGGTSSTTTTARQYISTGVILSVTPRINAGGRVTLDVTQEVSSAGAAAAGANPPINQRKAQTVVTVGSGETMVLAGMIQNDTGTGSSGIPLISKIPLIGGLFGSQSFRNNRTELVILITPTVVSNSDEAKALSEEIRQKLPTLGRMIPKPGKEAP